MYSGIYEATKIAMAKGICDAQSFSSFERTADLLESIRNIEQLAEQIHALNLKDQQNNQMITGLVCDQEQLLRKFTPYLPWQDIVSVLRKSGPKTVVEKLNQKACEGKRVVVNGSLKIHFDNNESTMMDQINKLLQKDQPSGIAVTMNKILDTGSDFNHALVVIGRSYDPQRKECLYKLRNSWGDFCSMLTSSKNKNKIKSNNILKCEDGNILVSHQTLQDALLSVTYITK